MKRILPFLLIIVAVIIIGFLVTHGSQQINSEQNTQSLAELPESTQIYIQTLIDNIRSGGPPKDGIPSVDQPTFESVQEADEWLLPNDVVFGIEHNGETRAYPQRIVVWHEIVNDTIAGDDFSLTYCPLTGTAIGFTGETTAQDPTLGVSGKLVNSNLIMYDRETDSYIPQILGQAITGPRTGEYLDEFPVTWTTWERWKTVHPDTTVLARETGWFRDYSVLGDPYGSYIDLDQRNNYYTSNRTIFAPINEDDRLEEKDVVVGVRDQNRNAAAVLKNVLRTQNRVTVSLGEREVEITYNEALDSHSARYIDTNEWVNSIDSMWFPWASYFPETTLITN